ncbi:MAG: hypothetical protein GQ559_06930 [Desulfobulbaceae bacterium]|nr:hypothetical protein [Desulfobulbaceae bacterium]
MSLNGIWVLEIGAIFGWERMSTVILEKGRYLGGGAIFSSQGTYITDGDKVKIKLQVTQYDEHRIAWGKKRKQFTTVITAKRDGDKIEGKARLKGAGSTTVKYPVRFLRLADLPPFPKKFKKKS